MLKKCSVCHLSIDSEVVFCPYCGSSTKHKKSGNPCIFLGYTFIIASLMLFPPFFMVGGIVCGIYNMTKAEPVHGVVQIVLALICGVIGMVLGEIVAAIIIN